MLSCLESLNTCTQHFLVYKDKTWMNLHLNFENSKVCHPYLMLYSTNTLFGLHKSTIKHIIVVPDTITDVEWHQGTIYIFGISKVYCYNGNKLEKVVESYNREHTTSQYLPVHDSKVMLQDWIELKSTITHAIRYKDYLVVQFEKSIAVYDSNLISVHTFKMESFALHEYMNLLLIHTSEGVFYFDDLFKERIVFPFAQSPFLIHNDKLYQSQGSKTVVTNLLTKTSAYLHFNVHAIGKSVMASSGRTLDLYQFDHYKVTKSKSVTSGTLFKQHYSNPVFVSGCGDYVFLCQNDKIIRYHALSGRNDLEIDLNAHTVLSHSLRKYVIALSSNSMHILSWDCKTKKSLNCHFKSIYFMREYLVCATDFNIIVYAIEDDFELNKVREFNSKQFSPSNYAIKSISIVDFHLFLATSSSIFKIDIINSGISKMDLDSTDILQLNCWRNLFVVRHADGIRLWKNIEFNYATSSEDIELTDEDSVSVLSDIDMDEDIEFVDSIKGFSFGSTLNVWKNVLNWQKIQQRNSTEKQVPFFLGDLQETTQEIGTVTLEQPIPQLPEFIQKKDIKDIVELLLKSSAPTVDIALRSLTENDKIDLIHLLIQGTKSLDKFEYLNAWMTVLLQAIGKKRVTLESKAYINRLNEFESNYQFVMCYLNKLSNE